MYQRIQYPQAMSGGTRQTHATATYVFFSEACCRGGRATLKHFSTFYQKTVVQRQR